MAEYYPCPKMTPKQWIANFWYYYKWFTILGVIVFAFILIATVQYFTKSEPDLGIVYAGAQEVSERSCEEMIAFTEGKIFDSNEDGKISASFQNFLLLSNYDYLTEGQKLQAKEEFQAYSDEILSGDANVLILDQYLTPTAILKTKCNKGVKMNNDAKQFLKDLENEQVLKRLHINQQTIDNTKRIKNTYELSILNRNIDKNNK